MLTAKENAKRVGTGVLDATLGLGGLVANAAVGIGRGADWVKQKSEPYSNNIPLLAGMWSAGLAGTIKLSQMPQFNDPDLTVPGYLTLAAGGAVLAGATSLLAQKQHEHGASRLSRWTDCASAIRPAAWSMALGGLLAYNTGAHTLDTPRLEWRDNVPAAQRVLEPWNNVDPEMGLEWLPGVERASTQRSGTSHQFSRESLRIPPPGVLGLGYTPIVEYPELEDAVLLPLSDPQGRFEYNAAARLQRVERFAPIVEAVAQRYGLPANTLKALAMQESFGDPLIPNLTHDGGIGLYHMQGTTAVGLGLRIHGSSTAAHDPQHGQQLVELFDSCEQQLPCIAQSDSRGHVIANTDGAARYVLIKGGIENLEQGIMGYRGSIHPSTSEAYLHSVRRFERALETPLVRELASREFERANGYSLDEFLDKSHEENENWGLSSYRSIQ